MATKFAGDGGSYDKSVEDSGKGQSKAKFSNPIQKPTDNFKKPTDKGNGTKWGGTGRNKDQHAS